jgi:hypothetical protein
MRQEFITSEGEFSGEPGSGAIINSSACNYREGSGPDDLPDLLGHIAEVMGSLNRTDGFRAFATTPIVGNRNAPDLFLYGVQGSVSDWAARSAAMQASAGGPSLGRHFRKILDCTQSLWFGQPVVPVPE